MATKTVLALDVGSKRIGIAMATLIAKLASPYGVIENNQQVFTNINQLVNSHSVTAIVVGLPRSLEGQETDQTRQVKQFVNNLKTKVNVPIYMQDEALTSKKAEAELSNRKALYNKEAIDALAATYILGDFLEEHTELMSEV